ncbi:hypothetical protein CMI37_30980 [Candidatus Pacearchaeota archaeon]|nr:hypothetical protein [Candidatus Pacearchaeota archaeon]|tara:strand:- start:4659 stop:4838 length:180 start_codon:yes stop_codon:yes gene_type:complete
MGTIKFKWLSDSCRARKGKELIKNQIHDGSDYPEAVVAEWVKTKDAAYCSNDPSKGKVK